VVGTNILVTWEGVETRTLVTWEEEALRPLSGRLHCVKITRRMEGASSERDVSLLMVSSNYER